MADHTKESTEMFTIDCPLCAGEATTDEALTLVACDGCGVTVEVAPDPARWLEIAA
jgi:ribosomal protein S27E